MEPEICMKMLGILIEKLEAKFPVTTHGYSMAKKIKMPISMMLSQKFFNGK